MSLIYLATPYWSEKAWLRAERTIMAKRITAALIVRGNIVFSPILYGAAFRDFVQDWGHDEWLDFDKCFLTRCSEMYVARIPGWDQSRGVREEIDHCKKLSIPVKYMSPDDIERIIREALTGEY